MLTLVSEKGGSLHFRPDQGLVLTRTPEMNYRIHESDERKIAWSTWKRETYQSDLFIYRSTKEDSIIFSELAYPCTLIFIFGYGICLYLSPGLKREMQDRSGHFFYSSDLQCRIRFQKDREYLLAFIQYSKNFILTELAERDPAIWLFWENSTPAFYYSRSRILTRNFMELLSILMFPEDFSIAEYILRDEAARAILLDFLNEPEGLFQPAHLTTSELNVFYMERDRLITASRTRGSLPNLLKKSEIHFAAHFRKRIRQLYQLNITQFITEIRIARAAVLLKDPALSIKEIAGKTGFPNASYFSRVFTHYYGFSPKAFRAQF